MDGLEEQLRSRQYMDDEAGVEGLVSGRVNKSIYDTTNEVTFLTFHCSGMLSIKLQTIYRKG